jgi:hypothetical protein
MIKYILGIALIPAMYFFLKSDGTPSNESGVVSVAFDQYWYQGLAEVSSYDLKQYRYGEMHDGDAVMIFVTEDFSKSKQVKLDNPLSAGKDRSPVLKMNAGRYFNTGVYPYSILHSTFTPVDRSGTLKTSTTIQEWCGHAYTQCNRKDKKYAFKIHSYFESEGDQSLDLSADAMLEDELWTLIRISPEKIAVGKQKMIVGSTIARLKHVPIEARDATISRDATVLDGTNCTALSCAYSDRTLKIYYETAFPYKILGWDETYKEWKGDAKTTTARLRKSMMLPYWELHNPEHTIYRDSLGLSRSL